MKRLRLKKTLRAVSILLLLPLLFLTWLLSTETGLQLVYKKSKNYLPGNLTISKLEGNLLGTINASIIQYEQDGVIIKANKLTLQWLPATLLSQTINISDLQVQALKVFIVTAKNGANNKTDSLPEINLPWRVVLKNIVINDFNFSQKNENYSLKTIRLNASSLFNKINIKSLLFKTEHSEFNLSGQLNTKQKYQHMLDVQWQTKLPNKAVLAGKGRIEGNINILKVQQQVTGLIQLNFKADIKNLLKKLSWQAEADIIDFSSEKIWSEWSSQLKGKLFTTGHTEKEELSGNVTIKQLSGTLRGYPVSLNSRLDFQQSDFTLRAFNLRSGNSLLSAKGHVDSELNLNWTLNSNNLAELYPNASGQLYATGQLSGTPAIPKLKAHLTGKNLALSTYKVDELKGDIAFDIFHWQQIYINLAAQSLNINKYEVNALDISADNHKLQLKATSETETALVQLKGNFFTQGLQGTIEKADLISSRFSDWILKTPANFNISTKQISIEPLCWKSLKARACTTLQNNKQRWQSHFEFKDLPLMLFSTWLPPDLKLEGVTNASATFDFSPSASLQGQVRITLPPDVVSYPMLEGKREYMKYRGGTVDVVINNKGLNANSEIIINNEDRIKAQLTLPDIDLLKVDSHKQIIQADAQLTVKNIGFIKALVPDVQSIKGEAALNFSVSGTLAQPKLNGHAHLNNSSLYIPGLGLSIDELNLTSQSDGLEKINFQMSARSGAGNISVQAQTRLEPQLGWPTTINIKGENFEVSRIPASHIMASPDLQITLQKNNINIGGTVHIPYAKLQPKNISSAARLSDDIKFVGDNRVLDEKWLINTKIRLTLGERIHFYGFGFEGRFGGNILLEDKPGQLTKALGEIKVEEGRYTAYGQRLTVEHGRLLYTNGPITNPGLDLRAVRRINAITAGLKVRGTLNNPRVELFSIPAMGQTDTLSYILLGRPIENASGKEGEAMAKAALALSLAGGDSLARTIGARFGLDDLRVESSDTGEQASLVIGRYLSPKLYIGYGVGLIESFNTFNVRYQLSDKWQLKGESGEYQSADILYTIER